MRNGFSRMPEIERRIAAKIKYLRIKNNVTQPELAELIGVTYQQLSKYEDGRNRITPAPLSIIAERFNVPFEFFVDGIDPPISKETKLEKITRIFKKKTVDPKPNPG